MRVLEERLDIRLLTRTTRSVLPTEAGERLLAGVGRRLDEIESELEALTELRDKPAGTVRLTAIQFSAEMILLPKLAKVLADYPDIKVEISINYGLNDIVSDGFDAGVRGGEQIAKDMIAVRISADMRMVVVGAPAYFSDRKKPKTPQDLTQHNCINMRLPTSGGLYAWEFAKGGRELRVRVEGQLTFNSASTILKAALSGLGLAMLPAEQVKQYIDSGALVRVLSDWCPEFPGYHLYYPSRRQLSTAFKIVLEALRHKE